MVGQTLAHYQIRERLGHGGMGEIYRATDTHLKRDVALKLITAELEGDANHLARLQHEAEAVAALSHPHIVQIYSIEEADGHRFLTMELVEGQTLDRLVPKQGMPISMLLSIGVAISDALAAAHAKGIVHRDLKPANVMWSQDRGVKILDFGVARRVLGPSANSDTSATSLLPLTSVGAAVGTVPYMSPEQVRGEVVDARSDIFSFGVLMYELAMGRRPFEADNSSETMSSILRDQPALLSAVRPELPRHLARIVARCLEKDPSRRFQSAADIRNDLDGLREELRQDTLSSSTPAAVPAKEARRSGASSRRFWARLGASVALMLAAAFAILWIQRSGDGEPSAGDGALPAATTSIAVLPFSNLSSDPDQEYFSDGLTDELSSSLVKIPELRVAGRISTARFKNHSEDLMTIAHRLDVSHILEGSVRKSGDRIRITVQLVNAADGFQLWSQQYDRTLEDAFAVQADIAASVARELRTTLLGQTPDWTPSPQAYDLVLRSRHVLQKGGAENTSNARKMLEQAIAIEPGYARAWAALGLVHFRENEAATTAEEKQAAIEQARAALTKALELDPNSAIAQSQMVGVHVATWNFSEAERFAERALQLGPRIPAVMGNAAYLFRGLGRFEEAIALEEQILRAEPLALDVYNNLAASYTMADRWADAESTLAKLLHLEPSYVEARSQLGTVHLMQGRKSEARAEFGHFTELAGWGEYGRLFYDALVLPGDEAAAHAFEQRYGQEDPSGCAQVRAFRGDADAAFAWLEKAYARRDPYLAYLKADLYLRPIHGDPRWPGLLDRVGLPTS